MKTEILKPTEKNIEKCADCLRSGGLVAFPTETVYGLGASAFCGEAASHIFEVKGRPPVKPLTVHVSGIEQIERVAYVTDRDRKLIDEFMPGPLTLVLRKKTGLPDSVTAGGNTVGVRMPAHETALALIRAAGLPVCAPSANTSAYPAPTAASHVLDDLGGKIPYILDGGTCLLGIESTVVDMTRDVPMILREGRVPIAELQRVLGEVRVSGTTEGQSAINLIYVPFGEQSAGLAANAYDEAKKGGQNPVIICLDNRRALYGERATIGAGDTAMSYAHNLFERLRLANGYSPIIAEGTADLDEAARARLKKYARRIIGAAEQK